MAAPASLDFEECLQRTDAGLGEGRFSDDIEGDKEGLGGVAPVPGCGEPLAFVVEAVWL